MIACAVYGTEGREFESLRACSRIARADGGSPVWPQERCAFHATKPGPNVLVQLVRGSLCGPVRMFDASASCTGSGAGGQSSGGAADHAIAIASG
jgi:hypothetical protein